MLAETSQNLRFFRDRTGSQAVGPRHASFDASGQSGRGGVNGDQRRAALHAFSKGSVQLETRGGVDLLIGAGAAGAELDIVVVMVLRVGLPPRGRQKGESDA